MDFKHSKTEVKIERRDRNGITLIALVITIIVLLILAGVSISMLSGDNSILGRASSARETSGTRQIEERVKLAYTGALTNGKGTINQESLEEELTKEFGAKDTAYTIQDTGSEWLVTVKGTGAQSDVPVTIPKPSNMAGTATPTETTTPTPEPTNVPSATDIAEANAENKFKTDYGRIDVIWLQGKTNTPVTTPNQPVYSDGHGNEMTPVTFTENAGTWTESSGTWNSSNSSWDNAVSITSDWSNYYKPATTNTTVDTTERGDYRQSKWANAKTANGSYFVWIPRYAYRITYYDDINDTTPNGYYDGYGMWEAETKKVKYTLPSTIETVIYNGNKYIVHPVFTNDSDTVFDNGGWDDELSGFWFAKYEMSGSPSNATATSDVLKSVPNVSSKRSANIGTMYKYCRFSNYGYTSNLIAETLQSGGTDYTYTGYMSSHLMKNSEWGAVAYLTHSGYGRNGNEISVNQCSSYYTGYGKGTGDKAIYEPSAVTAAQKYNGEIGVLSSTTGNAYGVYDMSGGAFEYSASYDKLSTHAYMTTNLTYGALMTKEAKNGSNEYVSTKYIMGYTNGTSSYYGNNIIYNTTGKIGDATKEVNVGGNYASTGTTQYYNWFNDFPYVCCSSKYPFFRRSGYYGSGANAGVFSSDYNHGGGYSSSSFRTVLCP